MCAISVVDLYGLLLFLGVEPYWVQAWWSRLLYTPYCHGNREPLHQLLSQVLWRTAKKDVLDQVVLKSLSVSSAGPMYRQELNLVPCVQMS